MLPNVIIAGAPRSGTTSLFNYLTAHPQACGSNVKETRYLLDKDFYLSCPSSNYHQQGLSGYKSFFKHCPNSAKIIIEATPMYLYNQTPLEVLSNLDPAPEILFILRNPAYRAYSFYKFAYNYLTSIKSEFPFSQFIDLLQNYEQGNKLCSEEDNILKYFDNVICNILEEGKYEKYLKRWFELYDNRKIHVYLYEEFRKYPKKIIKDICSVLEIDFCFYDSYNFSIYNQSFFKLHPNLYRNMKKIERNLSNKVKNNNLLYSRVKNWQKKMLVFINFKQNKQFSIDNNTYQTILNLHNYYHQFNKDLEKIIDLDFSQWKID